MSQDINKTAFDLHILSAMSSELEEYLKSKVLFWPLSAPDLPRLTLGGFLMRRDRLVQLPGLLNPTERQSVSDAVAAFEIATAERSVITENRAKEELDVRLRQWQSYLKELFSNKQWAVNYVTAVENRAMIAALLGLLSFTPYQMPTDLPRRVADIDSALRSRWQKGAFIWPADWQAAYPENEFWWLYGTHLG